MSTWTWFRWSLKDDNKLKASVKNSDGYAQVIADFGWAPSGSSYRRVQARIKELGITTSHFLGAGHGRGYKKPSDRLVKEIFTSLFKKFKPGEQIPKSSRLRVLLIRHGVKDKKCEKCGLCQWMGEEIPLELDHIDGNKYDNRMRNLRLLCPNCHAQTETHGSKNRETMRAFRASGLNLCELSTKEEDCKEIAKKMGWTVRSLQEKIRAARRAKKLAAQSTG